MEEEEYGCLEVNGIMYGRDGGFLKPVSEYKGMLYPNRIDVNAKWLCRCGMGGFSVYEDKVRCQSCGNEISYRDWETDRKSTRLNSSHRL